MLSKQEQRELLLLQCDLARAKLRYTQQQAAQRKQAARAKSNGMAWQLADAAGEVARNTDSLKLAMLPAKWKHRAALGNGQAREIARVGFRLLGGMRQPENQKTA